MARGEVETLFHAGAVGLDEVVHSILQAELFSGSLNALVYLLLGHEGQRSEELEVFATGEPPVHAALAGEQDAEIAAHLA